MDNSTQQPGSRRYCAKCLSVLGERRVRDVAGREFCSKFCRSEWWAERRRSEQEVYEWWIGRQKQQGGKVEWSLRKKM